MTPFERRLARLEEIRCLSPVDGPVRLVFLRSPAGISDVGEQERWAAEHPVVYSDAACTRPDPLGRAGAMCICFIGVSSA